MITSEIATVSALDLRPDPSRVILRPFIPGLENVSPAGSRAGSVIDRVLAMDESTVTVTLAELTTRFGDRHRDLATVFERNAELVAVYLPPGARISAIKMRLLGAYFTHEFSIEGAALANPSIVPYPLPSSTGETPFVMSVRCIGEGHRSSIGFRAGRVDADGTVTVDPPSRFAASASGGSGIHHRNAFHAKLAHLGHGTEEVSEMLSMLPPTFVDSDLTSVLAELASDAPRITDELVAHATDISKWSYQVSFPEESDVSERVLWPHAPPEYHGMEDARFVRFEHADGRVSYLATYTAYDRSNISLQLLETTDFLNFSSSPIGGMAATGKGLAIFPRTVGGRFVALTRSDRESNGVAYSDDLRRWSTTELVEVPQEPWELIQLGNCGSPIETEHGWLVLTHGVGPMRTYCIGALLLDLECPSKPLARMTTPLLVPDGERMDGYVPNVLYTCGAMAVGDTLVMPFGIGDQRIGLATVSIEKLVHSMKEFPA